MVVVILLFITVAGVGMGFWIRKTVQETERKKYYDAASRMLKENCLNQIILNHGQKAVASEKIMLYIKTLDKPKTGFVFDPEKGIRIGRSQEGNDICIQDIQVSSYHCCLYLYQGQPVIQDFSSANGTQIKRGRKKYRVYQTGRVFSGDKLILGNARLEIEFFRFAISTIY